MGHFGWVTHVICGGEKEDAVLQFRKLDPTISLPPSTSVGILGMPGYFKLN